MLATMHNAIKVIPAQYDVQNLVLKVYAEFKVSAKKLEELKKFYEEFDLCYMKLIKHGVTRWLTLFAAVDRILKSWPAIKSYFLSQREEKCDKIIWNFIKSDEDEFVDDLPRSSTEQNLSFAEMYLYFVHHYMNNLQESILILEKNDVTSTELHSVMAKLKESLTSRLDQSFFGSNIRKNLKFLGVMFC